MTTQTVPTAGEALPVDVNELAARNQADRVAAFGRAAGRPFVDEPDLAASHMAARGMFFNQAIVRRAPDGAAGWRELAERVAAVIPAPAPALMVVPDGDASPLAELGWAHAGQPPLMVRPAGGDGPGVPDGLVVTEVVDEVGLEVFERTVVDGYPSPDVQPYRWGGYLSGDLLGGGTRYWLGSVVGRPVATAWSHTAAGVNGVEAVATMADDRGRGYGAAVTWAATVADPSLPAILYASDLGRPVYERMGYEVVCRWDLWLRP